MIACYIVIGRVDVSWIPHFTLHGHVFHWMRDILPMNALLVITNHLRVLKRDVHG